MVSFSLPSTTPILSINFFLPFVHSHSHAHLFTDLNINNLVLKNFLNCYKDKNEMNSKEKEKLKHLYNEFSFLHSVFVVVADSSKNVARIFVFLHRFE